MIVSFLALYWLTGAQTFNMAELGRLSPMLTKTQGILVFGGMFIGFGIKVPIFPFHTWLPDAHTQAPTAGLGHPGRGAAEARDVRLRADRHRHPARGPRIRGHR